MGGVEWPLAGRSEELRYLGEALGQPGVTGVVLVGPAGVGKTRLAREVVEAAGHASVWVTATRAGSSIPFAPLVHLLPDRRTALGPDRLAMFVAVADALVERAQGHPLIVGVDDAHFLDAASAALVLHLALTGAAVVVATVRAGEPVEDPIIALWKDGGALRLELQALSEAETAAMVAGALGGHVERATAAWLFEATQGNPLFVRELVAGALGAGTLCQVGGAWRWSGELATSGRLAATVKMRLSSLAAPGRRALELLALGEPLEVGLLEALVGLDALVEAEQSGFLVVERHEPQLHARLAHPLYGEVLRGSMPGAALRARYRQLADATDASASVGHDDALRQVVWRMEAGDSLPPEVLTEAAQRASARFDHDLARRLASSALEGGGGFSAALALAKACSGQQRFADAEAALAPWESAPKAGREAAHYLLLRVHALHWGLGRTAEATAYLARVKRARPERARAELVQAVQAHLLALDGHLDEALALGRPLVDGAGVDERAVLKAVSPVAMALSLKGLTDTALSVLDGAAEIADRLADELSEASLWFGAQRVVALLLSGRLTELEALLVPAHTAAVTRRDHHARASAAMLLGRVALQRGAVTSSRRWLEEAVDPYRGSDPGGVLSGCLAVLSQAHSQAGDVDRARAARDEARRRCRQASQWQEGDLAVADVWVAVASGDSVRGAALAERHATRLSGVPFFEATLLHQAVRLGVKPAGGAQRLGELAASAESRWVKVLADHARALAADDGDALEQVATSFEGFGALLVALEAAAQAAESHRRTGAATAARRCVARSQRLAQSCEGAMTPVLQTGDDLPLTRRERDVATLAGRGLGNDAIAERLVVSVRTVESHLYRAYAKLGVHRRQELAHLVDSHSGAARKSAPLSADARVVRH